MQEQGPMESWSSNHSSKAEGRTLHPHQAVNRGNALLKKVLSLAVLLLLR